jgi:L-amino acid N-acyltransferase YncA
MFREASAKDTTSWLNIRNDPDALFWSGNKKPISWKEHEAWFMRSVVDVNRNFLAVSENTIVDAYGRIQQSNDSEVSLGVLPEMRGMGLGKGMLQYLEAEARLRRIDRLVAYIAPGNVASLGAFRSQGYYLETNHKLYEKLVKPLCP